MHSRVISGRTENRQSTSVAYTLSDPSRACVTRSGQHTFSFSRYADCVSGFGYRATVRWRRRAPAGPGAYNAVFGPLTLSSSNNKNSVQCPRTVYILSNMTHKRRKPPDICCGGFHFLQSTVSRSPRKRATLPRYSRVRPSAKRGTPSTVPTATRHGRGHGRGVEPGTRMATDAR